MAYGLERDGRTVYCSSPRVTSALLEMGWTLRDTCEMSTLPRELAADVPVRRAPPVHPLSAAGRSVRTIQVMKAEGLPDLSVGRRRGSR
jgi:hypothetical protein